MTMVAKNSLTWTSEETAVFFLLLSKAEYVAVDTETNGADIRDGSGYCQGVSVSFHVSHTAPPLSCYLPFRHTRDNLDKLCLAQLKEALESASILIFHNAKFDLVSLKTLGIDYQGKFYDTMLMAHWIDENILNKSLDSLSKMYCGNEGKKISPHFAGILDIYGWADMPSKEIVEYAANDALITLELFDTLYPEFRLQEFDGELWEIEQKWVRLISRMENRGVRIDLSLAKEYSVAGRSMMNILAADIGFNPGSPLQLGKFLIDELNLPVVKKTPKGKASFDKEAMLEYEQLLEKTNDERATAVLEYRGWQ